MYQLPLLKAEFTPKQFATGKTRSATCDIRYRIVITLSFEIANLTLQQKQQICTGPIDKLQ